jgi:hypothetical protein
MLQMNFCPGLVWALTPTECLLWLNMSLVSRDAWRCFIIVLSGSCHRLQQSQRVVSPVYTRATGLIFRYSVLIAA